jgi:hypothetical protein
MPSQKPRIDGRRRSNKEEDRQVNAIGKRGGGEEEEEERRRMGIR